MHAECLVRDGGHPVLERRLLEVLEAVKPRRQPVARHDHFARNFGVTALVRVDDRPVIGAREPDHDECQDQDGEGAARERGVRWHRRVGNGNSRQGGRNSGTAATRAMAMAKASARGTKFTPPSETSATRPKIYTVRKAGPHQDIRTIDALRRVDHSGSRREKRPARQVPMAERVNWRPQEEEGASISNFRRFARRALEKCQSPCNQRELSVGASVSRRRRQRGIATACRRLSARCDRFSWRLSPRRRRPTVLRGRHPSQACAHRRAIVPLPRARRIRG